MKGMKFLLAAALVLLVAAVIFWWLQRNRAAEQAKRATLIFNEQAREEPAAPPKREPAPPVSNLSVVTDETGAFTVQISSWRSDAKAEHEAERFRSAGYPAYVQRAYLETRNEVWYRVRVGHFTQHREAERQARDLEAQLDAGYWITQKP